MNLLPLAQVDWVFLSLGVALLLLLSVWPSFRRAVREINLGYAEGDIIRSLDAAIRLRQSWNPLAILNRLVFTGNAELIITQRMVFAGHMPEAALWCKEGLRVARKPDTRIRLHILAALIDSQSGRADLVEQHLDAARDILRRHAATLPPELAATCDATAVQCYRSMGQHRRAIDFAAGAIRSRDTSIAIDITRATLSTLNDLGQFETVLNWTHWMIDPQLVPTPRQTAPAASGIGAEQVYHATDALRESNLLLAATTAARESQHWDLYEQYLLRLKAQSMLTPILQVAYLGREAVWAAHNGNAAAVSSFEAQLRLLADRHVRLLPIRIEAEASIGKAWQLMGEHERALSAFTAVPLDALPPADRSRLSAETAQSLACVGREAEAIALRESAKQLAPDAFWNRLQQSPSTEIEVLPPAPISAPAEIPALIAPSTHPVPPVVSGLACVAWVLATFVFFPLLGPPIALALLILGAVLLLRRKPLPLDRRAGWGATALAILGLAFTGIVASHILPYWLSPRGRVAASRLVYGIRHGRSALTEMMAATSEPPTTAPAEEAPDSDTAADAVEPETVQVAPREEVDEMPAGSRSRHDVQDAGEPVYRRYGVYLAVLIASIVLHEIGHAVAAWWCGDPTARDLGRISLNPMRHVSLVGSVIVPGVLLLLPGATVIGWAKPVPVRPDRYRSQRKGQLAVTLAGVSLNLLLATMCAQLLALTAILLVRLYPGVIAGDLIHPMQSSLPAGVPYGPCWSLWLDVLKAGVLVNSVLMGFNLLPIPPLDGFGVIRALVPRAWLPAMGRIGGLATVFLFMLIAFNLLGKLLIPAIWLVIALFAAAYLFSGGNL